jgi:hypothetical protein
MLITHNSINLERPSLKCRSIVEETKTKRINLSEHESSILKKLKNEFNIKENEIIKKKKKKHGINPLSIKKKKKNLPKIELINQTKKKRRRTRQIRMSFHLKQHLKELKKQFSIKDFFNIK